MYPSLAARDLAARDYAQMFHSVRNDLEYHIAPTHEQPGPMQRSLVPFQQLKLQAVYQNHGPIA